MNKKKIVYLFAGGVIVAQQFEEGTHVPDVAEFQAAQPTYRPLPIYVPPHGSDPQEPGGQLREPWATAVSSGANVTLALRGQSMSAEQALLSTSITTSLST
jgi:hypothetical protein